MGRRIQSGRRGQPPAEQAALIAATQRPASFVAVAEPSGPPAWKAVPSWALIGTQDKIIPPAELRKMAEHAGSQISEIDASRVSMVSHLDAVTVLIKKVATHVASATAPVCAIASGSRALSRTSSWGSRARTRCYGPPQFVLIESSTPPSDLKTTTTSPPLASHV